MTLTWPIWICAVPVPKPGWAIVRRGRIHAAILVDRYAVDTSPRTLRRPPELSLPHL